MAADQIVNVQMVQALDQGHPKDKVDLLLLHMEKESSQLAQELEIQFLHNCWPWPNTCTTDVSRIGE